LKVTGEQDPDPDPDLLVKSRDPRIRIRIRIHTGKMSRIQNTAIYNLPSAGTVPTVSEKTPCASKYKIGNLMN
jgi:hypothetical protein